VSVFSLTTHFKAAGRRIDGQRRCLHLFFQPMPCSSIPAALGSGPTHFVVICAVRFTNGPPAISARVSSSFWSP
jgi:hypothetical protein